MTTEDLDKLNKKNYDAERYITLYQNNARDVLGLIDGTLKLTNHAWIETLVSPISIDEDALSGQDGLVDMMEFISSDVFANGIREMDNVLTNEGIKHFFVVPADYCGRPDTVDILLIEGKYEMYIGCSMYPDSEEMGYSTNTLIDMEQHLCLPYLKEPTQSWKQIAEFWTEAFKEMMNMKPPLDPTMTEEHEIDVEDLSRFHINDRYDDMYTLYTYDERGSIIVNPVLIKLMDKYKRFKIRIGVGESSYSEAEFDSCEMMVHVAGSVITAKRKDFEFEIEIRPSDLSYYRYIKIEVIK